MLTSNQRRLDANKLLRCSVASGLLSQQRYEARHEDTQVVCRLVYLVAKRDLALLISNSDLALPLGALASRAAVRSTDATDAPDHGTSLRQRRTEANKIVTK